MTTTPEMKKFVRLGSIVGNKDRAQIDRVAAWISREVDAKAEPLCLRFRDLRPMDAHPIVYLAERAITALIRKVDLYHVVSPTSDRKAVAEVEEWLWPLMERGLLGVLARAFVYGSIPYVLDLGDDELVVRVPSEDGTGVRKKTLPAPGGSYLRFVDVHELRPDQVELKVDGDELVSITDLWTGAVYDAGRARVMIFDRQFGEWTGQSARRRAWPAWVKSKIFETLQARYLERTVHTPLIITAPGTDVRPEGETQDVPVGDYIAAQLASLMGGGYMTLPNDKEADGSTPKYSVTPLELPERSQVWERALDRFDAQILTAYLVPPAMAQIEDAAGGGAARVLRDLFSTFVEALVGSVAAELSCLVRLVHGLNYDPKKILPCEVKANEIPDKVQKLYLDVLATVGDAARLGERVDVDALLDHLNVPRRPDAPANLLPPVTPAPGQPGRPIDIMGEREVRREDAVTEQGQQDTGAPRDENGDPIRKPAA